MNCILEGHDILQESIRRFLEIIDTFHRLCSISVRSGSKYEVEESRKVGKFDEIVERAERISKRGRLGIGKRGRRQEERCREESFFGSCSPVISKSVAYPYQSDSGCGSESQATETNKHHFDRVALYSPPPFIMTL